ncbi:hypothetical protein LTS08_002510 [Lithohypha guttulata]|nr:hypothetical protein LTS08_002510 [Lithohypha guttulata]
MGVDHAVRPAQEDLSEVSSLEKELRSTEVEVGYASEEKRKYLQAGLSSDDAEFLLSLTPKQQSAIYHKVDVRVVPMLALLYLIAHLDRANIGNAKIEGIERSLGMRGTDYNVAVAIFFIPYILCEVPSNLILAKFKKPSTYIGILVCAWGLIMTCSGFVQGLWSLCFTRFLIGLFEAGFFPGSMWLISQWYEPRRTGFRMSLFYFSSAASGAFSGLLAAGIAQMDGLGGLEGWRWIFIIEGIVSVIIGAGCFLLLPDTPSLSSRWLKPDEIRFLNLKFQATRGSARDELAEKKPRSTPRGSVVMQVLTDKHLYLQALVFMSNSVPNYGLKFTMPQIIRNMGFTSTNAQLLTAPPYFLGAFSALFCSFLADRFTWRMPFIVSCQSLLLVAYSVLFVKAPKISDNVPLCYVMVAFACMGVYPIIPNCTAWTVNNLAGSEKRSMGIGLMIAMGNCGGIVGSFIFLDKEKPRYPSGFGSSLSFAAAGLVAALTLEFFYNRHNKKYEHMSEEEIRQKYSSAELEKLGDRSPLFKNSL